MELSNNIFFFIISLLKVKKHFVGFSQLFIYLALDLKIAPVPRASVISSERTIC